RRWRAVVQARRVSEPPCFRGELHDVLFAFRIDDVVAEAAGRDERRVSCNVAGTLKELAGRQSFEQKDRPDQIEIAGMGGRWRLEVDAQDVERARCHGAHECYHRWSIHFADPGEGLMPTTDNMPGTETFRNGELTLFFRSWHPAGTPRGVVVIVPGFNSHS